MFVTDLPKEAAFRMIKACTNINVFHKQSCCDLVRRLIKFLHTSPEFVLEAFGEIALLIPCEMSVCLPQAFEPLLDVLEDSDGEYDELVVTCLTSAICQMGMAEGEEWIDRICDYLILEPRLAELTFEFLAAVYHGSRLPFRFGPQLDELMRNALVSRGMFRMLTNLDVRWFPSDIVSERLVQGISDMNPAISRAALGCAESLMISTSDEWYSEVVLTYREVIIRTVLEAMLDRMHINDFGRHTKVLSRIMSNASSSDERFFDEFLMCWVTVTKMEKEKVASLLESLMSYCDDIYSVRSSISRTMVALKTCSDALFGAICESLCEEAKLFENQDLWPQPLEVSVKDELSVLKDDEDASMREAEEDEVVIRGMKLLTM
jgi:hypothetical protein